MGTETLMALLGGVTLPVVFPEGVIPVLLMLLYMHLYLCGTPQLRSLVISRASRKGRDVQPSGSSSYGFLLSFPQSGKVPSQCLQSGLMWHYVAESGVPPALSSSLVEASVLWRRERVAQRVSKLLDWSKPVKSEQMDTLALQKSSSSPCSSLAPHPVSAFQFSLQAFDSCSRGNCTCVVSWG